MQLEKFARDIELSGDSLATVKAYVYDVKKFEEFIISNGKTDPNYEPSEDDVKDYLLYLKRKNLENSTIARRFYAVFRYFQLQRRQRELEFIAENLVPKQQMHEASYLTLDQIKKIFQICDNLIEHSNGQEQIIHVRNKVMIYTFVISGMRRGELLNLTTDNIDFKNKLLKLERLKQKEKSKVGYIPLTQSDCELYRAWIAIKPESKWLFPGRNPEVPLSGPSAWSIASKIGKLAGLKVWPHEFRHTVATLMLESGESMEGIANILGHRSVDTSRLIYASVTPKHLENRMLNYRKHLSDDLDEK